MPPAVPAAPTLLTPGLCARSLLPLPPQMSAQDSFEVAFNAACALIESGSLAEAEKQLQLAQRVGEH
jgi:hypothetical protein